MEDRQKGYRDLRVWQRAIELVPKVYELVRRFPPEERYELASQVRRAIVSVPANIAEGQARRSKKEFLQSLHVARGSLAEVETLLIVAEKLGYLTQAQLTEIDQAIIDVRMPLQGLINSLQARS